MSTQPQSELLGTNLGAVIARVAGALHDANFPTGERAHLRRLDPESPGSRIGAVCRVLASVGADVSRMSETGLTRWSLVLHSMAIVSGSGVSIHDPKIGVGRALAPASDNKLGYSELRFMRLLSARGQSFRDQVVRVSRFLAQRGGRMNWRQLAELVFAEGQDEETAEKLRFRIARDYYSTVSRDLSRERNSQAHPEEPKNG